MSMASKVVKLHHLRLCFGFRGEEETASRMPLLPPGEASDARDRDLSRVEAHVQPSRAHGWVSDRELDPVAAGRRRLKGVGPEGPRASVTAPDLLDGREAQVRREADAQGTWRSPPAPEDADDAVRDLAFAADQPFHSNRKRRRIDGGRLEVPGQPRPFRPAPRLDQPAAARTPRRLAGPPALLPHPLPPRT